MVELEGMPGVKNWAKRHSIKIPYQILFVNRHYEPDFLIEFNDGSKEIHETKGTPFFSWLSTHKKRASTEDYCKKLGWKYKFITKDKAVFYKNNYLNSIRGKINQ